MTAEFGLKKLFEPGHLGQMELKNRIVMAPMWTHYASPDGYVTDQMKDYYEERAKGGVGLIIVEITAVDSKQGKRSQRQLAIDDDRFIPGLRQLAHVIHRRGAKAALQLVHAGNTVQEVHSLQPVAPSATGRTGRSGLSEQPRELLASEIADIVAQFARGTERAKEAGFDGVEVHAAHMYLIADFLSSTWNKRKDAYGGDIKNRARFLLEIVESIRKSVGQDYPVWCRINGEEQGAGGLILEEAQVVARMLQDAGVDAIHVSASAWYPARPFPGSPMSHRVWTYPPGHYVHLAEGIKKVVSVPVIAVGRITPQLGERILREGKADFVAIGRALLADPQLPNKVASGRLGDIVPCLACDECGNQKVSKRCTVNAALGREREYRIQLADKRKKVVIVGGGPAGMEAARVAALRGHEVTLYEKEHELGGKLVVAAAPPSSKGIKALTGYLKKQVRKLHVKVELGKEVTAALVQEIEPDVVIVATGATPFTPEIPGIDSSNVVNSLDVLAGRVEVGNKVIVIGGELVGCNVAEFLAASGKKVTITRRSSAMAVRVLAPWRFVILNKLVELGATMVTGVKEYKGITDAGLVITNRKGDTQTIEADTIVLATGARSNTRLFKDLDGKVPEIYLAGDCVAPRRAVDAIADASRIARGI